MIILFLGFVEFRLFFFFLKNVTLENAALFYWPPSIFYSYVISGSQHGYHFCFYFRKTL